jgi:hypothetical protein
MSFETDWTKFKFGLATDITNALAIAAPVDTGELRNSINHDIEGDEIHIEMARHGLYVELGTPPHIIKPVTAKALHWKDGGKDVFAKKVMHPGTRPNPFIRTTLKTKLPGLIDKNIGRSFA